MNLFTKNIRGFVDFGKQAEPKNPCLEIRYSVDICFWSLLQQEKSVLHQKSELRGKQLEIIGSPKIYCAENKVRFLLFLHSYPHQLPAMLESSGLYKLYVEAEVATP